MRALLRTIPDEKTLLDLEPEELAGQLLLALREQLQKEGSNTLLHRQSTSNLFTATNDGNPPYRNTSEVTAAIAEAWAWLENQVLLIPAEGSNGHSGFRHFSRRAWKITNETDFAKYQATRLLHESALHPTIVKQSWFPYLSGRIESAVLEAMKAVEVAVRDASGLGNEFYGVTLMRKAFDPKNGPLTDPAQQSSEAEALASLFAGVIGSYKNPVSHRAVEIDSVEGAEMLMLASHLLRIVDTRKQKKLRNE